MVRKKKKMAAHVLTLVFRCEEGAKHYGYNTEYHGIGLLHGKYDGLENGHCTQACIFTCQSTKVEQDLSHGNPHTLVKHIEFPYYNQPKASEERINEKLLHYIEVLCVSETLAKEDSKSTIKHNYNIPNEEESSIDIDHVTDWSKFNLTEHIPDIDTQPISTTPEKKLQHTMIPLHLPVSSLWSILNLRQMCGTKETLINSLSCLDEKDYELMNDNETLVVKKSFKLDLDDDNHSAKTFSSGNSW